MQSSSPPLAEPNEAARPAVVEGGVDDSRALRRSLGRFPTGVTVVTCLSAAGEPVGVTANSFSSVSLDPPLVLWSIARKARSAAAFEAAERFAFSILALEQADLSNRFAQQGTDKFAGIATEAGLGGVPLIAGAAATIECVRHAIYPGGDHTIVVGAVVRHTRAPVAPLVFGDGRYGALAPHPGAMGTPRRDGPGALHPYDDFLVPLLFRAYTQLFGGFADTIEGRGASRGGLRVLASLSARGPLGWDDLAHHTMLSETTLKEALDGLVTADLVASEAPRWAITPAGERRLGELLDAAAAHEGEALKALDASEATLLRTLLRKLADRPDD